MVHPSRSTLEAKLSTDHAFYQVIQDAYPAFSCQTPIATGGCIDCCMEPEIEADFLIPPIADLPAAYLRDWFFAAADHPMPKNIWGYLLPRVLECLAAKQELSSNGLEVTLNRFATGDRCQWNDRQWSVLDRFQRQYLSHSCADDDWHLDDVLCMFGSAGWPLEDLFSQVAGLSDDVLIHKLWRDWGRYSHRIWLTAFWEDSEKERALGFYTSQALYDRVVAVALEDKSAPELAQKAMVVSDVICAAADWATH